MLRCTCLREWQMPWPWLRSDGHLCLPAYLMNTTGMNL